MSKLQWPPGPPRGHVHRQYLIADDIWVEARQGHRAGWSMRTVQQVVEKATGVKFPSFSSFKQTAQRAWNRMGI